MSNNASDPKSAMVEVASVLAKTLEVLYRPLIGFDLSKLFSREKREQARKQELHNRIEALKALNDSGIEPIILATFLNSEVDRNLKRQFGRLFFWFTVLFSALAIGIVILNSMKNWGIPEFAVNALIIEIPIQFIGILYIIAHNLFPKKYS